MQDGSLGCRSAHDKFLIAGCAGDVIGDMAVKLLGRVSELGNIMGDVNTGHFAFDIFAKLSTMSDVAGHCRFRG